MITYKLEGNWHSFVFHLLKSWSFKRTYKGLLIIAIYSSMAAAFMTYTGFNANIKGEIFNLLSGIYALLIIFKTNQSYSRWWEGRKLWGSLINNTRNLSIYLHQSIPKEDQENRSFFAHHISLFSQSLAFHLRKLPQQTIKSELKEYYGKDIDLDSIHHLPMYISSGLFARIKKVYDDGILSDADFINIKPQHQALLDILGACERIQKTPIPFSYAAYMKFILIIFSILLPFSIFPLMGWIAIPFGMMVLGTLISLDMMAEEIEEPFGMNENDLNLTAMAGTVSNSVYEVFGLYDKVIIKDAPPPFSHVH